MAPNPNSYDAERRLLQQEAKNASKLFGFQARLVKPFSGSMRTFLVDANSTEGKAVKLILKCQEKEPGFPIWLCTELLSFEPRFGKAVKNRFELLATQNFANPMNTLKTLSQTLQLGTSSEFTRGLYKLHLSYQMVNQPENGAFMDSAWTSASLGAGWGVWELHWILPFKQAENLAELCNDLGETEGPLFDSEQLEELNDWVRLISSGFAFLFMENACFILNYPVQSLDQNRRFHNEKGSAVKFSDGQQLFAFHGISVPEWMISRKYLINPVLIDLCANAEQRRAMIEIYGWEKYLRSFGGKLLHQDECGKLYRRRGVRRIFDRWRNEVDDAVLAVEVINSTPEPDGSLKRYLLRVPPEMTTARQAVAWTFGLTANEYHPEKET